MANRRKYTREREAELMEILARNQGNIKKTAREERVDTGTLRNIRERASYIPRVMKPTLTRELSQPARAIFLTWLRAQTIEELDEDPCTIHNMMADRN